LWEIRSPTKISHKWDIQDKKNKGDFSLKDRVSRLKKHLFKVSLAKVIFHNKWLLFIFGGNRNFYTTRDLYYPEYSIFQLGESLWEIDFIGKNSSGQKKKKIIPLFVALVNLGVKYQLKEPILFSQENSGKKI
jgi:hypothetical protein